MPERKISWIEVIKTFWPIVVFIIGIAVWIVTSQTVSHAKFNSLSVRVSLVETQVPEKSVMLKIQENQAAMRAQLDILTKNVDTLLEKLL